MGEVSPAPPCEPPSGGSSARLEVPLHAAKAAVAAITAFLGFAAARQVELGFWLEAGLLTALAAFTVYTIPNKSQ
jgi:hypothetical protein